MGQHVPPPNNLALVALAVTGPMSASFDQTELNQVMVGLAGAPPDVLISIVTYIELSKGSVVSDFRSQAAVLYSITLITLINPNKP